MNSIVTEKSLLAACLANVEDLDDVLGKLPSGAFYHDSYRVIYDAMRELRSSSQPVDAITLGAHLSLAGQLDDLRVGEDVGEKVLGTLANCEALNVDAYVKIIVDAWMVRRFTGVCQEGIKDIAATGQLEVIDRTAQRIADISGATTEDRAEFVGVIVSRVLREMENPQFASGLSSYIPSLDKALGKLRQGDLTIVAARPGMGKTSIVVQVGAENAKHGTGVFMASLEMPEAQLVLRMASTEAKLNLRKVLDNAASWEERLRLADAEKKLKPLPFIVDDTPGITLQRLRSAITRARRRLGKRKTELELVVVDYLQLMRGSGDTQNREQEVAEISRGLKALAKEAKVHVIALAQLNRKCEERPDKRPMMSDTRDSGAIEQDADNIIFIYQDEKYNRQTRMKGVAELIVGKQRNGPAGEIYYVGFNGETTSFYELTEQQRLVAGLDKLAP